MSAANRFFWLPALLLALMPLLAPARTLVVGPTEAIRTVGRALAGAKAGDTVRIRPGVYAHHNLLIDKPLTILGENFPVLDAQFKGELFTVRSDDVTIRGLEMRNVGVTSTIDWAAVKVLASRRVRIVGNRLRRCYFGIYLSAAADCLVMGNDVAGTPTVEQNTGNGIHAWKCDRLRILNNHVRGQRDGIYFEFVTASVIRNNLSEENIRYGLHFMFSHENGYFQNTFRHNGAGVAVMYTRRVTMQGNTFAHNWGGSAYGILLKDITDSQIYRNTFIHNTVGIHMEGSSRIDVRQNQFRENGWGLRVQASCNDNEFMRNSFSGNTFDVATNGNTVLNTFRQNYWDKYEGYDLDRNGRGDVPYHPVSLFSVIIERMPHAVVLLRSFMVTLLDRAEKVIPALTPSDLVDNEPLMKPV